MDETSVASEGEQAPDLRDLLRAARGGDEAAGSRLVALLLPTVFALQSGYARLRACSRPLEVASSPPPSDAELETTRRTIHPLVSRLARYRAARALEPWVWRIGLNVSFTRDRAGEDAMTRGHAAALVLRAGLDLEVEAVAAVLGSPPDVIAPRIAHARRLLLARSGAKGGGCVEQQAAVDAWLEELLIGRERLEWERHLAACSACAEEAAGLQSVNAWILRGFEADRAHAATFADWNEIATIAWRDALASPANRIEPRRAQRGRPGLWLLALLALIVGVVVAWKALR